MIGAAPGRSGRALRAPAAALALAFALAFPACYDLPKPACGFRCGPDQACPEDYTCNPSDGRCHLIGAPAELVCGTVDAGLDGPGDAVDAPDDAAGGDAALGPAPP